MNRAKKQAKKLDSRRQDYTQMLAKGSKESGVQRRMDSGGFHRPGSNHK